MKRPRSEVRQQRQQDGLLVYVVDVETNFGGQTTDEVIRFGTLNGTRLPLEEVRRRVLGR